MRTTHKQRDNAHYLGLIRHIIIEIIVEPSQNVMLQELKKRLDSESFTLLLKLGMLLVGEKLAKEQKIDAVAKMKNAVDWDTFSKAKKLEEDCASQIIQEISAIEPLRFIHFAAEFIATLAIIRGNRFMQDNSSLYRAWRSEVAQVVRKTKYLNQQEQMKKLLEIILGNKLDDVAALINEENSEIERFGHRVSVRATVDLEAELDTKRLQCGRYFIEHLGLHTEGLPPIVTEDDEYIHIEIDGKQSQISLRDYFEYRMPTLRPSILESKDLLDNILIVYMIKIAQGGNKQAFEFFYKCYKRKAELKAISFIKGKAVSLTGKERFAGSITFSEDNIRTIASSILSLLLKGDEPHTILQYLAKGEERPDVSLMLNRRLQKIISHSYQMAILNLEAVIQTLDAGDKKYRGDLKRLRYRASKAVKDNSQREYWIKVLNLGLMRIWAMDSQVWSSSVSLKPTVMVSYSPYFNKGTYKPNKNSNLTYWLFGDEKFRGVFIQKLNEWYKSQTYTVGGRRCVREEEFDAKEFDEDAQGAHMRHSDEDWEEI